MATVTDTWTGNTEDGDDLDGSSATGVAKWLTALQAGINSIVDAQVATAAAIQGSKLADNSIPTAKYANSSVTGAKIANTTVKEGNILRADATDGILGLLTLAPQRQIIWGSAAFSLAGATEDVVAVDFSVDAADAAAAADFSSTTDLVILVSLEDAASPTDSLVVYADSIATTGFNAIVRAADNASCTEAGNVHWIAIGRTA